MRIPTRKWGRRAVLLFTLMNLIAGVVALRPALTSRAAASAQSGWKEDTLSQMIDLEAAIVRLKRQLADSPKDATLKEQLEAALNRYDQLSAQMGGDRAPATGKGTPVSAPTSPSGGLGVVPPPASGCTPTTASFNNNTLVVIPTGPAVVTSTITVAGAGPYLWDLNMQTFITHTFNADLDITLQSPAGTVVTITTDNGGGNDNVFNGTVWDDQANPGGQVPYSANNGLVTDQTYVNLVTATPLVPEEAMGAFIGENPNGTWTLTISDDLAGDGGNLASWELEVTTFSSVPTPTVATVTNTTPVAIPTGPAVVTSTITVAGAGTSLCDLNMTTNITHTFNADLDITLQSPAGTVVTITTDNGGGNDDVFNGTVWDDQANPGGQVPYSANNGLVTDQTYVNLVTATPLVPEEAMAAFIGENPNGTWTLTISDDLAGDGGNLASWSLQVTTCACGGGGCSSITCPANITQPNDPNQCGAVVTYPAPTPNGSCGTITCSPASGSFFPVGTTTVTCTSSAGPTCTFTVTVQDTQPPSITCPANITKSNDPNQCGAVVTYPPPTITDNCPGNFTATCSPASGSFFPVGTTTVSCSVNLGGTAPQPESVAVACTNKTITESTSQAITSLNSVSCNNGVGHTDNSYWRAFSLPSFSIVGAFNVLSVDIGVEQASSAVAGPTSKPSIGPRKGGAAKTAQGKSAPTGASQPLTVRIYTSSMAFPAGWPGSLTLIGTTNTTVLDQSGTIINVPVTGTAPAGSQLVVEVFTPDGTAAGNLFFIGSNAAAETGPSYLSAAACGVTNPTTTAALGFPNMHIVMNVKGCEQVAGGGSTCTFTVRVNDTQPPTITCPPNQTAVTDQNVCPAPACKVVTFPPPVASDNCPGVVVVCNPPSGSCFPTGVTTVTCTATDASGNTASCSFTASVFDTALEDDSNPAIILLWNSNTGAYRFCCNGITFTGVGKATRQGCVYTLDGNAVDRRVLGRVDKAVHAGAGSLQAPPGTTRCTITDRNTLNDTLTPACQ